MGVEPTTFGLLVHHSPNALLSLGSSAQVNTYLHGTCDTCDIMKTYNFTWMESVFQFYIRTILRATSMMITKTDNDQLIYWKVQWLRWDWNPLPLGYWSAALPTALPSLGSNAWVNPCLHGTCDSCDIMKTYNFTWMESVFRFYIRTILRATSMMITNTDNDQLNYWKIQWLRWDSNSRTSCY